jgi:DNA modification methylase
MPELAMSRDYEDRTYLSSIEAAKYLDISVKELHRLTREGVLDAKMATSGQKRYDLKVIKQARGKRTRSSGSTPAGPKPRNTIRLNGTVQKVFVSDSSHMKEIKDDSVHLMVTSPPYFNAKMYSDRPIDNDLGNIHELDEWFERIGKVWAEVYRVLQPGRKAFINIMNLPIRTGKTFRTLNLVGRTIEVCEDIGFIFKRDIVWQKTNGVKAHFGTYPYPGGILLNHMHEFILEFHKPDDPKFKKYDHIPKDIKERSKLDKEFWLSIKNSDVWLMNPENSGDRRSHIAPFPRILPTRLIRAYTYIGETVLDPFMGSGTVLKVASDLERNGIGYEINPKIASEAMVSLKK